MIKVVGFDLGGVYLTDCWSVVVREKIAKKFHLDQSKIEEKNNLLHKKISNGLISEDIFLQELVGSDKKMIQEVKNLIRSLNKIIYPEMLGLMQKLKRNHKLVLVNNEGKEWNEFRIKKFNLGKIFDEILTSCFIGYSKPSQDYFKKVLARLNIKPSELLFIDNTIKNVISARNLGIVAIHFKNPDQLTGELSLLGIKVGA